MENKTFFRVLGGKIIEEFEGLSFSETIKNAFLILLAISLTAIISEPKGTILYLNSLLSWHNYLPLKGIFSFCVVFYGRLACVFIKRIRVKKNTALIEGVPKIEIIDHIFQNESFKRGDIKEKFGMAHGRFNILAQKLEDLGILVRGENNSRVLNPDITRQEVASILQTGEVAEDLKKQLKQVSANQWTAGPIKQLS